jgi:hypothetical protein
MKIKNIKVVLLVGLLFCSMIKANDKIQKFDLTEGTKDSNGARYAAENNGNVREFAFPLNYMGNIVRNYWNSNSGPEIITAPSEIKQLWEQGWTGKGSDILLIDYFSGKSAFHGVTTTMITDVFAPGATKYAFDINSMFLINITDSSGVINPIPYFWETTKDINGESITTKKYIKVINYSGTSMGLIDHLKHAIKGTYTLKNLDLSNAVVVKAAGNEAENISEKIISDASDWAKDENIGPRGESYELCK